jgi:hypothetical protein
MIMKSDGALAVVKKLKIKNHPILLLNTCLPQRAYLPKLHTPATLVM